MRRVEQEIQIALFEHFHRRGARGALFWHCGNGGYRRPVEAAILGAMGVMPGVADVNALYQGRFYACELKAPGGRLTDKQRAWMDAAEVAGAVCTVAVGLDEAIEFFEAHGLLRGEAQIAERRHGERRGYV